MEEQQQPQQAPETQPAQTDKDKAWCDQFPEPGPVTRGLAKVFQKGQDLANKAIARLPFGKALGAAANKLAPWNYKDGPFARCPVDTK